MEERPKEGLGEEYELEEEGKSEEEEVDEEVDEDEEDEEEDEVDEEEEEEEEEDSPPDLDSRILCSDGACIGVIGPNGKCKECGKPMAEQDAPLLEAALAKAGEEDEPEPDDDWPEEEEDDAPPDDLEDRELCADGNCIGLIGPNGRCKVCGRAAGDEPSDDEPEEEAAGDAPRPDAEEKPAEE